MTERGDIRPLGQSSQTANPNGPTMNPALSPRIAATDAAFSAPAGASRGPQTVTEWGNPTAKATDVAW
ncbi:MAG: hypothetical protein QM811_17685 [Pirellulales bacterium]